MMNPNSDTPTFDRRLWGRTGGRLSRTVLKCARHARLVALKYARNPANASAPADAAHRATVKVPANPRAARVVQA